MANWSALSLELRTATLDGLAARLEASSHQSVLRRGFSLTRDARSGKMIVRVPDATPGALITTQLQDGTFDSRVVERDETREESP